jgi:hypothetical protein
VRLEAAREIILVGPADRAASGTQTAYALALHMDLVPDSLRAAAASCLVAAIEAADWHLTTGFVGVGYLLPVLSSCGHPSVACRLLSLDGTLDWARGSYRSVRGVIRAGWRVAGGEFSYQVELPANVAATVHVPAAGGGGAEAVYRVGPGTHSFTGRVPRAEAL